MTGADLVCGGPYKPDRESPGFWHALGAQDRAHIHFSPGLHPQMLRSMVRDYCLRQHMMLLPTDREASCQEAVDAYVDGYFPHRSRLVYFIPDPFIGFSRVPIARLVERAGQVTVDILHDKISLLGNSQASALVQIVFGDLLREPMFDRLPSSVGPQVILGEPTLHCST